MVYVIIDDWDEVILGYTETEEAAENAAKKNEYLTGHSTYVHKCNDISEQEIPDKLYVCVRKAKYNESITTYVNPSNDIKDACESNEATVDMVDNCKYIYFTIGTKADESREELEERISSRMFLTLKEKGIK